MKYLITKYFKLNVLPCELIMLFSPPHKCLANQGTCMQQVRELQCSRWHCHSPPSPCETSVHMIDLFQY